MAENDLVITMTAVDNASAPIKSALSDINNAQNQVKKSGEEAGKGIQQQFKEAGKELKDFRQSAFLLTAALAAIVATTKEAAKYNKEAKSNFDAFTTSISSLSAVIGTSLSPALKGVSVLINFLRDSVEAIIAGFIKMFSFIFESFGAIASGMQNLADNIKNIFTGKEDPMGIVEGFRVSFQRAMDISNDAADQFLNKVEEVRARAEMGKTLEAEAKQETNLRKIVIDGQKKTKMGWDATKSSVIEFGNALKGAEVLGKGFAKAAAAVAMGMAIVNTAQGITAALAGPPTGPPWPINLAMATLVGATGALQIATIAAQSFAVGTPNVPSDMMAQVHQGETIIPATFADSIRRGELSLSGAGAGGGNGDIQINLYGITINSKENIRELAEELGFEIDRKFRNARSRV